MRLHLLALLMLVLAVTPSHATPRPGPFLAFTVPRNPCDTRPPQRRCVAEHRRDWRAFVRGTHGRHHHEHVFPLGSVARPSRLAHGDVSYETGWAFVVVFPDAPSRRAGAAWRVEVGGVEATSSLLHTRYVDRALGAYVIEVVVYADQLQPGAHRLTIAARDGRELFATDVELTAAAPAP